jgi:hypothetical protein
MPLPVGSRGLSVELNYIMHNDRDDGRKKKELDDVYVFML